MLRAAVLLASLSSVAATPDVEIQIADILAKLNDVT
jgi:hypothetical protein